MIHIRLVQNSWTQEKSWMVYPSPSLKRNSFVDVENVLASAPGLDTPWTLIMMIKSSKFGIPGRHGFGGETHSAIVITIGHLILIYSDHVIIINPHDVQARRTHKNSIRRHMSPHSPSMIHAMVMILPEELSSLQLTARPCQG